MNRALFWIAMAAIMAVAVALVLTAPPSPLQTDCEARGGVYQQDEGVCASAASVRPPVAR